LQQEIITGKLLIKSRADNGISSMSKDAVEPPYHVSEAAERLALTDYQIRYAYRRGELDAFGSGEPCSFGARAWIGCCAAIGRSTATIRRLTRAQRRSELQAMTMRFSILTEDAAGTASAQIWLDNNRDQDLAPFAELARSPFSGQSPEALRFALGLDKASWREWWAKYGTEQEPSHSFTRAFCKTVTESLPWHPPEPLDGGPG
jgi:hypothetical protein